MDEIIFQTIRSGVEGKQESEISGSRQSHSTLNLLKNYLNFGYYSCLFPLKITDDLEIKSVNKILKVLTAIVHIQTLFHILLHSFIKQLASTSSAGLTGPKKLEAFVSTAVFFHMGIVLRMAWVQQTLFQKVVRQVQKIEHMLEPRKGLPSKMMISLTSAVVIAIFVSTALLDLIFMVGELQNNNNIYKVFVNRVTSLYLFRNATDLDEDSLSIKIAASFEFISKFNFLLSSCFPDSLMVCFATSFYWLTNEFIKSLICGSGLKSTDQVINTAEAFLDLSDLCEELLGPIVTSYGIILLPMHALNIKEALTEGDVWRVLPVFLYALVWLIFMILSAQANFKFKAVIPYLRKSSRIPGFNIEREPELESRLSFLMYEMAENNLGIRGIGFTITYGLIGNVRDYKNLAGLLITCIRLTSGVAIFTMILVTLLDFFGMSVKIEKHNLINQFLTKANSEYLFRNESSLDENSWFLRLTALFVFAANFCSLFFCCYADIFVVSFAAILYWLAVGFSKSLPLSSNIKTTEQIINSVEGLMELSDLFYEYLGPVISCYTLVLLPLHSLNVKEALTMGYLGEILPVFFYVVVYLVFMLLSAEANTKFKAVLPYLRKSSKFKSAVRMEEMLELQQRLSVLIVEITGDSFGIRGVGFTITYGMIGNLIGLLVTCVIIIIQI
ncbi:unnamed protein product, partial [Allacma fusca]